jgi:uncharacterized circularly permuted ATP-grasp superfamily protein
MNLIDAWDIALQGGDEITPTFCLGLAAEMRARKLTFGQRVHCPFLRPFLLTAADEARIRGAAETIAAAGERVVQAALATPQLMDRLGVTAAERRLVAIDPGYERATTSSRLDAFLLPDSLHFAEYNAESPAGLGYTQKLCELFNVLPVMGRFRERFDVHFQTTIDAMLGALLASYAEWSGPHLSPPNVAIVDWRGLPTATEFEIMRDAFIAAGVPTVICDPRELEFDGRRLAAHDRRIDLVYRRVLINDIVERADDCAALVDAYSARAVCVANTFRCKLPHKKAFFAVLTDPAWASLFTPEMRAAIEATIPWTRLVRDEQVERGGRTTGLLEAARAGREQLVLKPNDEYGGKGVVLGWETSEAEWDRALQAAVTDSHGSWVVQERIPVRREVFPQFDEEGRVTAREMLVDFAPYLFRGRMRGFLTRLSATGLANVTSGGGQVPSFIVAERS